MSTILQPYMAHHPMGGNHHQKFVLAVDPGHALELVRKVDPELVISDIETVANLNDRLWRHSLRIPATAVPGVWPIPEDEWLTSLSNLRARGVLERYYEGRG